MGQLLSTLETCGTEDYSTRPSAYMEHQVLIEMKKKGQLPQEDDSKKRIDVMRSSMKQAVIDVKYYVGSRVSLFHFSDIDENPNEDKASDNSDDDSQAHGGDLKAKYLNRRRGSD